MAEILYRPKARLDLKEVYRYIAEINPDAAANVVRQVAAKARLLAETPRMGQLVENLSPKLRRFPVGVFLIFYREKDHGIEVVRVLHGARDIDAIFQDDSL